MSTWPSQTLDETGSNWIDDTRKNRRYADICISADRIRFGRTLLPWWAHASLLGQNKRMPVITRLTIELIIVP
jgi:hypothetical protein